MSVFSQNTSPKADARAVITGEKYRITVLTSRLIRIEYNENGVFEDGATKAVINRLFPLPDFTVKDEEGLLTVLTEDVELTYTKKEFSPNSLQMRYVGKNAAAKAGGFSSVWCFGIEGKYILDGTAATLDTVNGACPLEKSLMSHGAVTVLDDGASPLLSEDGRVSPRKEKGIDQYLFCYGDAKKKFDYMGCLKDYYALTGYTPLLPRFALGNWWSRYHAYTEEEYAELVLRFKKEGIPFSVAVIDMDWHLVNIDSRFGSGWTGYSWNRELFPDPAAFLSFLRREGMMPSLNLHPQEGVGAHEDAYEAMARAMGIDPKTKKSVPFAIEDPKFVENYFKLLHHPMEKEGVRFWWIDWQQGNTTKTEGIDPLWMLNHYHFTDNCKDGARGLIFSRYAGWGSQRYPVGFSGDTVISWESLAFQPYFTACATNVGYTWWSHDIGGHMQGYRDEELAARWYQLGVFSPINRLYSTNSEFLGKEPWKYGNEAGASMRKFLRLRHELIPYLYTMNYRTATEGDPLVKPVYYEHPTYEAYEFKNEFFFGSEMLVSPITAPHDDKTGMGSAKTFLPKGEWYDFFTHTRYVGDRVITLFRELDEMPVLVKAGGIVPMAKLSHVNDVENPKEMLIKVFVGADNNFEMYEDDGDTTAYKEERFAKTRFSLRWSDTPRFTVSAPEGDASVLPEGRGYTVEFIGISAVDSVCVTENGKAREHTLSYKEGVLTVTLEAVRGDICITFPTPVSRFDGKREKIQRLLERLEHVPNLAKDLIWDKVNASRESAKLLSDIAQHDLGEKVFLALCELITADAES